MLVNNSSNFAVSHPSFKPSTKVDDLYERKLIEAIPDFLYGLKNNTRSVKLNESGFSQEFITAMNRNLKGEGILAVPEYIDYYDAEANPCKRVDMAFVSSEQRASLTKLYTVEAKRLPTGAGVRKKEYVWGYAESGEASGGIQRFKTGDHGHGLSKSALLVYVEQNNFQYWHTNINSWIEKADYESVTARLAFSGKQRTSAEKISEKITWKTNEQLQVLNVDKTDDFATVRSVASRESDSIELFHLWVKIPVSLTITNE